VDKTLDENKLIYGVWKEENESLPLHWVDIVDVSI